MCRCAARAFDLRTKMARTIDRTCGPLLALFHRMRAWTVFFLFSVGCSSTGGTDAGMDSGSGADASDSGVVMMDSGTSNDSGVVTDSGLNGCTMFEDHSDPQAMRTITWQFN